MKKKILACLALISVSLYPLSSYLTTLAAFAIQDQIEIEKSDSLLR